MKSGSFSSYRAAGALGPQDPPDEVDTGDFLHRKLYDRCPCPAELRGNMPNSVCPLCKGVGFVEVGLTHGQVAMLMRNVERYKQALEDIQGHGVTLPAQKSITLTDEEKRWYARGLDSQRRIATEALKQDLTL